MFAAVRSRVQSARVDVSTAMAQGWWQLRFFVLRALVVLAVVVTLLWVSLFMYGSFYYAYMPPVSHTRDINFQFRTECDTPGVLCSFPSANLTLVHDDQLQLLMQGQPYRVIVDLEMPESPVNQKLGMFMVRLQFYSRQGKPLNTAIKSAMLQYKSSLLQILETLFFAPYLLFGYQEQKQIVSVVMFEKYQEDAYRSAVGVHIEVQTKRIEIYSATLRIHASFSGLRYFLYNWPVLSATVGIILNMFFLTIMGLLSWWRLLVSSSENTESFKLKKRKQRKPVSASSPEEIMTDSDPNSNNESISTNIHRDKDVSEETILKTVDDGSTDSGHIRTSKSDLEVDTETIGGGETVDVKEKFTESSDQDSELRLRKSAIS